MKLGLLTYPNSNNIGDEIQTLAVAQYALKNEKIFLSRDNLNEYNGEKCAVVMNGFFANNTTLPTSNRIIPIFFGFHIQKKSIKAYCKLKNYFKEFQPIGCRDNFTVNLLNSWGIESYLSGCATMTFPNRIKNNMQNKIIATDISKKKIKKEDHQYLEVVTHITNSNNLANLTKLNIARELLKFYYNNAKFIITDKIHCALPAQAMGIPVIFFGRINYRKSVINMFSTQIKKVPIFSKISLSNLKFFPIDVDNVKIKIEQDLRSRLIKNSIITNILTENFINAPDLLI